MIRRSLLRTMLARAIPALALLGSLALALPAAAQEEPLDVVRIEKAEVVPPAAPAGSTVEVKLTVSIAPEWHIYGIDSEAGGIPTGVALDESDAVTSTGTLAESPKAHEYVIEMGDDDLVQWVHTEEVVFTLPVTLAADAPEGALTLSGQVAFMVCDESKCLPPADAPFSVEVDVQAPAAGADTGDLVDLGDLGSGDPGGDLTKQNPSRVAGAEFLGPAAPGGEAVLEITFESLSDWHFYAQKHKEYQPPTFTWESSEGLEPKAVQDVGKPKLKKDEWLGDFDVFYGKLVLRQTFTVPASLAVGTYAIRGNATWQVCDAGSCISQEGVVDATLTVADGAVSVIGPRGSGGTGTDVEGASPDPGSVAPADPAASGGDTPPSGAITLTFLLQAAAWGFFTVLTPCVFPLLPISVSYFAKQEGKTLGLAIVFALGIVFTIVGVGLLLNESLGTVAAGWAFNALMTVIFVALTLSLFGMYDIQMPSFIVDRVSDKSQAGGYVGSFFMAMTLALTSFSCAVPFLLGLFTTFEKGERGQAMAGLLVYATIMALPFFLLALFPAALKKLPRSGAWMNAVKVTLGFVELALVFKFVRAFLVAIGQPDYMPGEFVYAAWAACGVAGFLYLLGYVVLPHDTKEESIGVIRMLFGILFLAGGLYFVPGVFGRPLPATDGFLLVSHAAETAGAGGKGTGHTTALEWKRNDWDGGLALAAQERKLMVIDFTGTG